MSFGIFYDFSLGAKIPTGVHEEDKDTKPVYIYLFGSIEFVCVFCRRVCFLFDCFCLTEEFRSGRE